MAQAAHARWTVDDFLAWDEREEERHELVDGLPVRLAPATNLHGAIVVNLIAELSRRLRGGSFEPFTGAFGLETGPGRFRRPDAGVDGGPCDGASFKAAEPHLVAEVLSPSTRDFEAFGKLAEYQAVASLDHILFVEPNEPVAVLWSRGPDRAWSWSRVEGLEAVVELPALGTALPMSGIYRAVTFPELRPPLGAG